MHNKIETLVIGHTANKVLSVLDGIEGINISAKTLAKPDSDPFEGLMKIPDILILQLGENWENTLNRLMNRPAVSNRALLVIGPDENPKILRMSMKAGARDFLTYSASDQELRDSVSAIATEIESNLHSSSHRSTCFISARGGSDATFIAANIAYIMSLLGETKTLAMDMDMQFSTLPLFLDVQIERSLFQALSMVDTLDQAALTGFGLKHKSGLFVMGSVSDELTLPGEVTAASMLKLLKLIRQTYRSACIILPRQIDQVTTTVLSNTDQAVIVARQSVSSLYIAKSLLTVMQRELMLDDQNIKIVVNSYKQSNRITMKDISQTLGVKNIVTLPEDLAAVTECSDAGIPLYEHAKHSVLTRSLITLAQTLYGDQFTGNRGIFRRAVSSIGRLVS